MIYPRKYGSKIATKSNPYNPHRNRYSLNAIDSLESNEAFFYKDSRESGAIQANQSNDSQDSPLFLAQSATYRNSQRGIYMQYPKVNPQNNSGFSANQTRNRTAPNRGGTQSAGKYYAALVPFVNHNLYYQAGNYQLSGLDYGFIGAFSGKLNNANALGAHLGFSYGTLGDKNDSVFSAKSINFMLGLNYKLDLIYDMFVKARGDFFYFTNEISTAQVAHTKPNDLGFGFGAAFGKDFDLATNGVFGLELGFDYKGLNTNAISIKSALDNSPMQDYEKSLYHLIYVDLGLKYTKFWANNFGLNIGAGIRGNLAPKLATSKMIERTNDNAINILLDNDKVLGYLNAGLGYVVEQKSYAMEFGLSYFGNFGDRSMSNGGSLEFRVNF